MLRRAAITAISGALGLGLVGLALIPGQHPATAVRADARKVAVASIASPSPDLLKHLDAEVATLPQKAEVATLPRKAVPPSVEPQPATPAPAIEGDPAPSVEEASLTAGVPLTTAAALADPAAMPADPSLHPETVGASAVNLRAGPSSGAEIIDVLQPGEAVAAGENSGGWINVRRADGTSGWVYSSYLSGGRRAAETRVADTSPDASPASVPDPAPTTARPRAVIRGAHGNLEDRIARIASRLPGYARPSDSAQTIFTFTPGDQVRIAEVRGHWLRVETGDGFSAWIRR